MKKIKGLYFIMILVSALLFTAISVSAASVDYTVQKGDSLYKISQKYQISINEIKKINGLKTDKIFVGKKLLIPIDDNKFKIHVVSKGESLYKISKWYNVSIKKIKELNNLKNDRIYIEQKLIIPSEQTNKTNVVSRSLNVDRDVYLLAKLIYAESRGEPFEGQVAVGAVALNRLKDPRFPKTIKEIIYEPYAFTSVIDGQINLIPNATAIKAAELAFRGWDPSGGALYYFNPEKSTSKWIWTRKIIKKIGNHLFAI